MNAASSTQKQVAFTVESITRDLTPQQDKPLWPLSSYGAAKGESNVISGQDESFEELRVKAAAALRSGSTAEYQQYESDKIAASNQVFGSALANPQQVFQRAYDLSGGGSKSATTTTVSAFAPAANRGSAFGSAVTTSAFGKPSGFGALGGTTTSAFGGTGTSAFGSTAAAQPAFGKSAFGQASQPAFGQSAFGQPQAQTTSVFGQPSPVTSAFGQTSAPSAPSAFGQPQVASAFGQPTQPQSSLIKPATSGAFGTASGGPISGGFGAFSGASTSLSSAPATTSAFGEAGAGPAPAAPGAFGSSAFGTAASSNPISGQSAFSSGGAAPSAFGQPAPTSVFGASQPPQATSVFGAAQNATSAFGSGGGGSGSVFGSNGTQSVFGQPQQPVSAFGANPSTSAFGSSSTPSAFGQPSSVFGAPAPAPKQKTGPPDFQAAIASFKATPGEDKYDALLPPNYVDLLPAAAREAFESAKFEWGKIPDLVPPPQFR